MTVCSGIGAPEHASPWIDWQYQSEIEKFPSAVLRERFPDATNLGDMAKFKEWPDANLDVLCGGTPCQSFSVAGLRAGMDDPRGQLMLTYLAIAARYRPRWLVWENVPGALSADEGRAIAALLKGMELLGYHAAWRVLDVQYGQTLRFPRAIPQRRNRLFVVGYLGDWRRAAEVLLEPQSLSRHPAPRREAGKGVAADVAPSLVSSGRGVERIGETRGQDPVVAVSNSGDVSYCLCANGQQSLDAETETLIATVSGDGSTHALTAVAFDTTQITSKANYSNPKPGDPCHPLASGAHPPAIAIQERAVAFDLRGREGGSQFEGPHDTANVRAASGGSSRSYVAHPWAVRRLTPTECERLMGFPDGWTQIPWRGKAAEFCPDGPRYKALGNSWGVNCGEYIFDRMRGVEGVDTR